MKAILLASFAATAAAYPIYKSCGSSYGADSNGVPVFGTAFTAMGTTWVQDGDATASSVFSVSDGVLSLNVPSPNIGFFAVTSSGTISVTSDDRSSSCDNTCDNLICIQGDGSVQVSVVDSNADTCGSVTLVVGYGESSSTTNNLAFAKINACAESTLTVSDVTATDTGSSAATATASIAAVAAATLVALAL
jgi:hypothetical protein